MTNADYVHPEKIYVRWDSDDGVQVFNSQDEMLKYALDGEEIGVYKLEKRGKLRIIAAID